MKRFLMVIGCMALAGCGPDRPQAPAPSSAPHKGSRCLLVMPMDLLLNGAFNNDKLVFVSGFCTFGEEADAMYATRDDMLHETAGASIELRPDTPVTPEQWKALRAKSGSWIGVTGFYHTSGGSPRLLRRGVIDVKVIVAGP